MWWNWQTRGTQNPVVAIPCGFDPHHRHQIGMDFAPFRFFFAEKSVICFVIPHLSQKGTLGSPVRLQAHSQRPAVAATFLRDSACGANTPLVRHCRSAANLLIPQLLYIKKGQRANKLTLFTSPAIFCKIIFPIIIVQIHSFFVS